jgi:hypothetical protein
MSKKQPCEELYILGKELWISDYTCPKLEDVFQKAREVASVLNVDFSRPDELYRLMEDAKISAAYELAMSNLWFQLGSIFSDATRAIAATSGRGGIPAKCGDLEDDISQPFPFMRYAMMCYSGGMGFKQFTIQPSPEEWRDCSNGKDEEHGNKCVTLATEAYNHALKAPQIGISIEEILDRAGSPQ